MRFFNDLIIKLTEDYETDEKKLNSLIPEYQNF